LGRLHFFKQIAVCCAGKVFHTHSNTFSASETRQPKLKHILLALAL
jgi:hypothetical protein